MRQFKFIGFGNKETFYGEGDFTVGVVYDVTDTYMCDDNMFSLRAIDDRGLHMWEECRAFEEVFPDDRP